MQLRTVAFFLTAALLLSCSERGGEGGGVAPSASGEVSAAQEAPAQPASDEPKTRTRRERPLPDFSGYTLEGEQLQMSSIIGRRLLLFVFNPELKETPVVARAVKAVSGERRDHNFQIVGVAVGSDRKTAEAFVREHALAFPVIDDSSAAIARRLGLRMPMVILGVDADGYIAFGLAQFTAEGPDPSSSVEAQLRTMLRLPSTAAEAAPVLGTRPEAPTFAADILDGGRFDLATHRGETVVLIFFLHTCPHCHDALGALKEDLARLPEDKRPKLVGIEVSGKTHAVREKMKELDLAFFPVVFDDDGSVRNAYGIFSGVPEIFLIDARGRIAARVSGWHAGRDRPLLRMRIAKEAGAPVPMLLRTKGFSGSDTCGVCHENEHETWLFTSHASAFDTLVKHGADNDEECIGCHVVGFGEQGGFVSPIETGDLENVGCESCHGRGGPHLSPGFPGDGGYATACATCHDAKHSLGFEFANFLPRVSHAANAHLTELPLEEKQKLLNHRSGPRKSLLPMTAAHVGSDACESCHTAEYATWAASRHAKAVERLAAKGEQANADCLRCHATGFGRDGGFPEGGATEAHVDLARVGCESCHGPGGDHVEEASTKIGSIVSLGDKCDSCVILQICGSCHDDANDPGFEFEVLEKIERQRHGTIEAGTGKPLGPSAANPQRDALLVGRAFHILDGR